MKTHQLSQSMDDGPQSYWKWVAGAWNRFWFSTADPTILGVIRIGAGLMALYFLLTYTLELQNFFGPNGLQNLPLRLKMVNETPFAPPPWTWTEERPAPQVASEFQRRFVQEYQKEYGKSPPARNLPENPEQARAVKEYIDYWGVDPNEALAVGAPIWSVWFHVTDPLAMYIVHWCFIVTVFLFVLGFCSRVTSVLTWFIILNYIHRAPTVLFGVDTMLNVTLLYLMIGPCGAALSADNMILRWWRRKRNLPGADPTGTGAAPISQDRPQPTVMANFAIRLLQVHLCFIYAAAGLAKLKGTSWWSGEAIWGTIANYEFAPMRSPLYMFLLDTLCQNQVLLRTFLFVGSYFTLFFEISYAFLIWNKYTRWLMLFMAVVLHGLIGLFMGLRTFSMMMLIMNMIFLPAVTVHWLVRKVQWGSRWRTLIAQQRAKEDFEDTTTELESSIKSTSAAGPQVKELRRSKAKDKRASNRIRRRK